MTTRVRRWHSTTNVLTSVAYFTHEKAWTVTPNFSSYLCSEKSIFVKYFTYPSKNYPSASPPVAVKFSQYTPRRRMGRVEIQLHSLGTKWRWVVTLMSQPLYPLPPWEKPRWPLNRRLGGPHGRSGTFWKRNVSLVLPFFSNDTRNVEPNPCSFGMTNLNQMLYADFFGFRLVHCFTRDVKVMWKFRYHFIAKSNFILGIRYSFYGIGQVYCKNKYTAPLLGAFLWVYQAGRRDPEM
jgi:hypothetical protein